MTTSTPSSRPDPDVDVGELAATLRATAEALEDHIQQRAAAIAAPRIAAAEQAAADRVAELEAEHARQQQRLEDLLAEMRRQLRPLLRERERWLPVAYAARHLPPGVQALLQPFAVWNRATLPPGVDPDWCQRVDRAAQQHSSPIPAPR